jgi:hypothetical protein
MPQCHRELSVYVSRALLIDQHLIVATALAGYASSRAKSHSVPISDTLTGFVTALPILAGLLLEGGYSATRRQERQQQLGRGEIQRPPLVIVANTIIFIYSTVVITLLGTRAAPPSGLDCGLRERWQTMFKQKDDKAIRAIQDAFNCCGLTNARDMAFPFPDKSHNQHACEETYGRNSGCLTAWRAEEQQIAGILIAVVGMVFVWQVRTTKFPSRLLVLTLCSSSSSPYPRRKSRGFTVSPLTASRG